MVILSAILLLFYLSAIEFSLQSVHVDSLHLVSPHRYQRDFLMSHIHEPLSLYVSPQPLVHHKMLDLPFETEFQQVIPWSAMGARNFEGTIYQNLSL